MKKSKIKRKGALSAEQLHHFRCGACDQWWSIGDAPNRRQWYCPRCGTLQNFNFKKTGPAGRNN